GIWVAALRELADTAESLGDQASTHVLRRRAERARAALEATFHEADADRYALNVRRDGDAWRRDLTQTAAHAVPLLLGSASPERARPWYDAVAGNDFTAPWGVRLLPRSHPDYDPGDEHGAVRPLHTGWVSWAEYAAGRAESAFRHWRMALDRGFDLARGAWAEALRGDEPRPIGCCHDHAWSTAMTVAPLVYGMLGAEPDAPKHRLRLRPQIPAEWDRLDVDRLRVGDAELSLRYRREDDRHIFHLDPTSGAVPLRVIFEPALPGEHVAAARVDGQDADLEPRAFGERILAPLQVVLDHERVVEIESTPDPEEP
ncbi:MAG: MGH1-like glycoside hydrolase domain-containing protein, partial [Gemmatimonadota bacterium]